MTVHTLMITDESGSMSGLANDIRGGHNEYLDRMTATGTDEDVRITATMFNTEVRILDMAVPVAAATRLDLTTYSPNGMTALLDAVGETLRIFKERVPLAEGDKVFVQIQTDGFEDSSKEHSRKSIAAQIAELETQNWSFTFSGSGIDDWTDRNSMGLSHASTYAAASPRGTRSLYKGRADTTIAYLAANPKTRAETFDSATVSGMIQETINEEGGLSDS